MTGLIANIILPFSVLFILNAGTVTISKRPFGKCLPITMMGIVYFLYFSQLIFGTFLCGFILIALFPAIVLILVITRKKKIERELLFSDGLAVFIIVYVLFTALSFNKWVLICDEFTHWGMMVKEMLRLDKFYCVPESRLAFHKDYPPFLSVFEYFWVKICGYYSEMGANVALGVFQLSLISAPFLEKKNDFNKKGWVRALIKSFAFLLIVVIIDPWCVLTTVYKDLALPLIFAYSISLLIDRTAINSVFGLLGFGMAVGALVSTKELGIAFAALSMTGYLYCILRDLVLRKIHVFRAIISMLLIVAFPCVMSVSWSNIKIKYLGNNYGQFSLSRIQPGIILGIIKGTDGGSRHIAFLSFVKAIIKYSISDVLSFSYFTVFFAVIILLILIWVRFRTDFKVYDAVGLGVLFVSGTIGFASTMGILYMFCFSEKEMLELASFTRYMSSYVLGEVLILFMLFVSFWEDKHDVDKYRMQIAALLAIVFLMTFAPSTTTWIPQSMRKGPFKTINAEVAETSYRFAGIISDYTEKDSDILLISSNADDEFVFRYIRYILNDREFDVGEPLSDISGISGSDYVFAMDIDDTVTEELSLLCESGEFKEGTVYRVINNGRGYRLEEVNL